MARIVIIGRRSLLAESFHRQLNGSEHDVVAFAHDEDADLDGAEVCINFAFHPELRTSEYLPEFDIDLAIAGRLPATCRYVMMSSRLVYGPHLACGSRVSDPRTLPSGAYGRNKARIESHLRDQIGDRLTILRVSNALIYRHGHPQFISRLMDSLRVDNEIRLDVSPFVRKDFVPEWYLMSAIATACTMTATGTFNVGAGQGVEIGRIALWVIEGFGRGKLVVTDPRERDEFWLEMSRSEPVFGPVPSRDEIAKACIAMGWSLAR